MEWRLARPKEFEKMAKEEQLCIVPLACLERHGEHMPFGTDGIIAEKIAVEAAKREPCMVFPTIYFGGEIHEATCFSGAVAFSNELCFRMWDSICSEIARNGFKKILFFNAHGGNVGMLSHYALSTLDHTEDYTFYWVNNTSNLTPEEMAKVNSIEKLDGEVYGHACQLECNLVMSAEPGSVDFSLLETTDTIYPLGRSKHLGRINTGFYWYSDYPDHQTGTPTRATKEKGDQLMEIYINRLVEDIKAIKADDVIPALHKEFLERKSNVGKFDE